jgi:hypothetical protein
MISSVPGVFAHEYQSDSRAGTDRQCEFASPILVDTTGGGFKLTSAEAGVMFDILGNGIPVRIAWTAAMPFWRWTVITTE